VPLGIEIGVAPNVLHLVVYVAVLILGVLRQNDIPSRLGRDGERKNGWLLPLRLLMQLVAHLQHHVARYAVGPHQRKNVARA